MSEEELTDAMADSTAPISKARADRYYDRVRKSIAAYLERRGNVVGRTGEFLLIVPDVFMLLWRLVNDGRVTSKNKVLLGSGLAYYIFPLDIIPEAILGPTGYLDDLVLAAYMLNKIIGDTDPEVLRQHWSGSDDVLRMIQKVLGSAENLVGSNKLAKLRKIVKG